jgi:hypothetical protein
MEYPSFISLNQFENKEGIKFSVQWTGWVSGARYLSLHHSNEISTEAHPASYSMGTRGSFARSKAIRA